MTISATVTHKEVTLTLIASNERTGDIPGRQSDRMPLEGGPPWAYECVTDVFRMQIEGLATLGQAHEDAFIVMELFVLEQLEGMDLPGGLMPVPRSCGTIMLTDFDLDCVLCCTEKDCTLKDPENSYGFSDLDMNMYAFHYKDHREYSEYDIMFRFAIRSVSDNNSPLEWSEMSDIMPGLLCACEAYIDNPNDGTGLGM
jgi:hypothetical protein